MCYSLIKPTTSPKSILGTKINQQKKHSHKNTTIIVRNSGSDIMTWGYFSSDRMVALFKVYDRIPMNVFTPEQKVWTTGGKQLWSVESGPKVSSVKTP